MESRQVVLLTKGYLSGILDFKYPNRLSRLREDYILSQLEKDIVLSFLEKKLNLESNLTTLNQKLVTAAQTTLEQCRELTLPYLKKKDKIKIAGNPANPEEKEYWDSVRSALKAKQEALNKENERKKKLAENAATDT